MGISPKSTKTAASTVGIEFNNPPILAVVYAARSRAFLKFPSLRTTIKMLVQNPPISRSSTWVSGTLRWLRRFCPDVFTVGSDDAHALVKQSCWDRFNHSSGSRTLQRFLENRFDTTTDFLAIGLRYPRLSKGFSWLSRIRVGGFWTARQLATIGYLDRRYLSECPICDCIVPSGETINHVLVGCARWADIRARYLGSLLQRGDATNFLALDVVQKTKVSR